MTMRRFERFPALVRKYVCALIVVSMVKVKAMYWGYDKKRLRHILFFEGKNKVVFLTLLENEIQKTDKTDVFLITRAAFNEFELQEYEVQPAP